MESEEMVLAGLERQLGQVDSRVHEEDYAYPHCVIHPYYHRHSEIIIHWLEGRFGFRQQLYLPRGILMTSIDAQSPSTLYEDVITRDVRVFGRAPYVGEPYVYWWWTGKDDRGRRVSGERHASYMDGRTVGE